MPHSSHTRDNDFSDELSIALWLSIGTSVGLALLVALG